MTTREELFEAEALPHLSSIYRTARYMAKDPSEAEDIAQDVFVQAWKSFDRYQPGTNCRAWLYRILFYVVQHSRRRTLRGRLRGFTASLDAVQEIAAYEPPIPPELRDEDVLAALARIPEHYRAVILLVDVAELAYREAADAREIPIGTVMSRLSRGRALLRSELAIVAREYGIGATTHVA